jgi:hypothetical protein
MKSITSGDESSNSELANFEQKLRTDPKNGRIWLDYGDMLADVFDRF